MNPSPVASGWCWEKVGGFGHHLVGGAVWVVPGETAHAKMAL